MQRRNACEILVEERDRKVPVVTNVYIYIYILNIILKRVL
jgi:hypothetical protein